ncbi:fructosamine kinase family protein [Synechococcus sp. CCY9201]|uniref:fructosamine kinase family protein n=1 Tax=Synechococcus sp. CCY9201 TaxID=174697 RepID=UPI002B21D252|nr:fructosamine kinase family protein [Synechococcus sp. CCY9201]MEA5475655.1 fructosamine kinase family protein [Synechococcus sp. CCY9201]
MLPSQLGLWARDHCGEAPASVEPVGGGCTGRAWRLRFSAHHSLFAKSLKPADLPLLQAEADGLGALAAAAPPELAVPQPLFVGLAAEAALLVTDWLPFCPSGGSQATANSSASQRGDAAARRQLGWQQLGRSLALLHRRSLDGVDARYGWPQDNWIGAAPQVNGWCDSWVEFFRDRRLLPQLEWVARGGAPLRQAATLLERLPQWLEGHQPEPVLVHGDLWGGNAALLDDGRGAIFDPAVYRGDREVDLAMARLFGGFPPAFFAGYEAAWPLSPGHRVRVELYNLYHLLNHANLFGGSYRQQAQASLDGLLRLG